MRSPRGSSDSGTPAPPPPGEDCPRGHSHQRDRVEQVLADVEQDLLVKLVDDRALHHALPSLVANSVEAPEFEQ